jgi:cytochrome c-type biogenesis protein CcmF
MLANLGYGALFITFLVSLYAIGAALYGLFQNKPNWVDSSRNAMLLTFPLLTLSSAILLYFLATHHYEVEYVAHVTSSTMPLYLRLTAWWGGQAGSLLFWSWLMSAFASAVTLRKWDRDREFLPWVVVISSITLAFFLALNIFVENPFARLWQFGTTEVVKAMFPLMRISISKISLAQYRAAVKGFGVERTAITAHTTGHARQPAQVPG